MPVFPVKSLPDLTPKDNLSGKEIADIDAEMAAHDSISSISDFMSDLENLYNAAYFYIALEAIYKKCKTSTVL